MPARHCEYPLPLVDVLYLENDINPVFRCLVSLVNSESYIIMFIYENSKYYKSSE